MPSTLAQLVSDVQPPCRAPRPQWAIPLCSSASGSSFREGDPQGLSWGMVWGRVTGEPTLRAGEGDLSLQGQLGSLPITWVASSLSLPTGTFHCTVIVLFS